MKINFSLALWACFVTSSNIVNAGLLVAPPTENCDTSVVTSKSTFCCNGNCIDQTSIGKPGACLNWDDQCQVAPNCKKNQIGGIKNQTSIDSGDGCCYLCGLNPQGCQWQKFQWTYNCCDCPFGYVADNGGECDIFGAVCYKCDGDNEVLTKNSSKWECKSSGTTTSKPTATGGSTLSTVGLQSATSSPEATAGASSSTDNNSTAIVSSTSKNGLSTGAKIGIGVGVPLAVIALAGLAALLWKTGMLCGSIGSTSAGANGGGTAIGATQAMQTSSAAKPLLISSNSADASMVSAIAGAAAATTAANMAANSSNTPNKIDPTHSSNPGDINNPTHAPNATGSSPSDPNTSVGSNAAGASPGDPSISSVGAAPSDPTTNIGATAAFPSGSEATNTIGKTGSSEAGTGSHVTGALPGLFGVLGLRKKKSKDKKNERPSLVTTGSSQQPLTGELEGGRNKFGPGDRKHETDGQEIKGHEISGDEIHEADENMVNEIDSTRRHEVK